MKKVARIFILLALTIILFVTAFAESNTYENDDGNYVYEFDRRGKVVLTKYNGFREELTLPEVIGNNYSVNSISHAFRYNYAIKVINIPDSISAINDMAFSNVYQLKTINIGAGVSFIGESPFVYSYKIENVNVSKDNQWFTDVDGVLFSKDMKRLVYYPVGRSETSYTIPDGVEVISEYAFYQEDDLVEIILPDTLTEIEDDAFNGCSSLKEIVFPSSLVTLGERSFDNCMALESIFFSKSIEKIGGSSFANSPILKNIEVDKENPVYFVDDGVLYSDHGSVLVIYPAGKGNEFVVPDGVTQIGTSAFSSAKALEKVTFPSSLTIIDKMAFYNCAALKDVVIPEGVTYIGNQAFDYCKSLTEVIIPRSVTTLGRSSFADCDSLKKVTYFKNVADNEAFIRNSRDLQKIVIYYDDVLPDDWFAPYTSFMYQTGMMKGVSSSDFDPSSNITYAQAITLAARIHAKFHCPEEVFVQSEIWYQVYLDYCIKNNLIKEGEIENLNAPIPREEFVRLVDVMPQSEYEIMNSNILPNDTEDASVVKFYKAGICVGSDENNTFFSTNLITRAEVSAIVSRMLDKTLRIKV